MNKFSRNVRVMIADDHGIVRDGVRSVLTAELKMEVVGEAVDGLHAVQLARELQPDLIIMDINMPGMNGIEATRTICHEMPDVKIVVLSMHSDKRYVMEMLSLGVSAYLLKDCARKELTVAIDKVLHQKTYISPDIGINVIRDCLEQLGMKEPTAFSPLSPRERQVLKLVADGRQNKEIADYLNMSVKTVEGHRQNIMQKLNLHTVAELTKYAIREGITSSDK
ncbi:MAG: response regulator transcription factor [Ignavibacteriales bacterium]|nr:response regulator transcription factor [Ignavibacteriales bacterium]